MRQACVRRLQLVRVALKGSSRFRLQTLLIGGAAATAVALMVASSSYAASGARDIVARYDAFGARMIVIAPAASRDVGGRAKTGAPVTTLSLADYRAIRAAEPHLSAASATVTNSYRMRAGDLNKQAAVVACEPDFFAIKQWRVVRGAIFGASEARTGARLALLGSGIANDLFGRDDPTGLRLMINRVPFTVAGVLQERGPQLDGSDEDDQVYVPLAAGMHRLNNIDYLGGILLQADSTGDLSEIASRAAALVAERHRRFTRGPPDFTVTNQQLIVENQLAAFARLSFLVRWLSASALIVCAFGISALCWMSVNGRRRDIGAMRALGARRDDVLTIFLVETLTPALLGVGAGLGIGFLAARSLEVRLGQTLWLDANSAALNAILAACIFTIVIAVTSWRATLVAPAVALSDG
jgi:putative ABC transport system permease protein